MKERERRSLGAQQGGPKGPKMAKIDQNLYFFYFAPIEYALVTSICCFYTDPIQGEKYNVIDEYQDPGGPTRGPKGPKMASGGLP